MANRVEPLPLGDVTLSETEAKKRGFTLSATFRKVIALIGSYGFLAIGALFMLFPVFWMVTAALKPTWQITASDIVIPSVWHKTPAGESLRMINLWKAPDIDNPENTRDVILFGARRQYLTMIDAGSLGEITAIPRSEAGTFTVINADDMQFNGLQWNGQGYILIGTDGDNLLTIAQNNLNMDAAVVVPRTIQRAAERGEAIIGDYSLQTRQIEIEGRGTLNLIEAGPNIELSTVLPSEYAQYTMLVPTSQFGDTERLPLGDSEAELYALNGDESGERYLLIERSDWRPVIGVDVLQEHAFTVPQADFIASGETITVNDGVFPTGQAVDANGETHEVALLVAQQIQRGTSQNVLVMPIEHLDSVQMVMSSSLLEPFPQNVNGTSIRVKDFDHPTVEEENIDLTRVAHYIAIIGDRQEMSLVLPASRVTEIYDVFNSDLRRNLSPNLQLQNFVRAMVRETGNATFLTFFRNSAVVSVLNIIGHLFSCTIVAYAFARMRAPGKNFLFLIVVATLMMPGFITVIPVYRIFRNLGMVDTLWPMFLRSFFGSAFFIFLMRQFFTTIPMELEEAATIDGASRIQTFTRIMLPLITPALATVVIFTFLNSWNNSFDAVIYLNSPKNYTVAIGLKQFIGQYSSEFNLLMAAATIVMLPTVLLFFFAQRFFIEGITLTGMKG